MVLISPKRHPENKSNRPRIPLTALYARLSTEASHERRETERDRMVNMQFSGLEAATAPLASPGHFFSPAYLSLAPLSLSRFLTVSLSLFPLHFLSLPLSAPPNPNANNEETFSSSLSLSTYSVQLCMPICPHPSLSLLRLFPSPSESRHVFPTFILLRRKLQANNLTGENQKVPQVKTYLCPEARRVSLGPWPGPPGSRPHAASEK